MASEPTAGGSARAQYARRRAARLERHRARFGRLAPLTYRIDGKRQSEEAWRKGAEGEELTSRRLDKHLRGSGVVVLHDLRIPRSNANIDHLCVGAGGITVVDSKHYKGRVEVWRGELRINGRRQGRLVEGVQSQVGHVRRVLEAAGLEGVDLRGALSMANVDGLPLLRRLEVDDVLIDGPRKVAKLARRPPRGIPLDVDRAIAILRKAMARAG